MRFLVVHEGRRDQYQVAAALVSAGHDVRLVTTAYSRAWLRYLARFVPLAGIRKLAARRSEFVPEEAVHGLLWSEVLSRVLRRVFGEPFAEEWLNQKLCDRAISLLRVEKFDAVVAYNYNAFCIFDSIEAQGVKRIIFQCHPHPVFIRNEFRRLSRLELATTVNDEKEFSYSAAYQAMLIAEPLLADKVLCASSFTQMTLTAFGIASDRIRIIPYGVAQRPCNFSRARQRGEVLRLLFVGQFVSRKGLAAVRRILDALHFDVSIKLVGRGGHDVDVDRLLEGTRHTAEVRWDVSDAELSKIYGESDVLLFPSIIEGFAHVILEAMSHGCVPVVSTNTCASDVIDHGVDGFVFPPEDVQGYIDAICALREFGRRESMSNAALAKARLFTWERFRENVAGAICGELSIGEADVTLTSSKSKALHPDRHPHSTARGAESFVN